MATVQKNERTGAEEVFWDLSDLYPSPSDAKFTQDLEDIASQGEQFSSRYHGKVSELSPEDFVSMLEEYERIVEIMRRLGSFTNLLWTTNTMNHEYGSLLQKVREKTSDAYQHLIFLHTEWAALPEEQAQRLIDSPSLARYAHWLEVARLFKEHTLSEAEEKILSDKSVTGRSAWVRYFDEVLNAQTYELDGIKLSQEEILSHLYQPDRNLRQRSTEAFSAGLRDIARTQAFVFNTVLADCASNDRLRNYPSWISSRNLDNEISDSSVDALVTAVSSRYDIVQRFYALKKKFLRADELFEWDRYAPISLSQKTWSWDQARTVVLDSYHSFHPQIGSIAEMFFDRHWIHAAVLPGKRSGAFSASTVPSAHPYVMMNYTGRTRDVQTLAHELGHGVHQFLSRKLGLLNADTPLTLAETASIFGETMVFRALLDKAEDDQARFSLLIDKIDDSIATVFRQISLNRFENAIHTARREEGELSVERISELWLETSREMFGSSVTLTENYSLWWSYISHFIHTPGYVYAYAFGELLVLALFEQYKREGASFRDKYIELLSSGGSQKPELMLSKLGINIDDPKFWHQGLELIESLVLQAEEIAARM